MVRCRAKGHPPRRTLCAYTMHIAPTLTSEFGFKERTAGKPLTVATRSHRPALVGHVGSLEGHWKGRWFHIRNPRSLADDP
jgi:hypothetical protein